MTDFMRRVDEALSGVPSAVRKPVLIDSPYLKAGEGAHQQVETRTYAEQLVCEANAVLSSAGQPTLSLDDLSGTRDQVFMIRRGAAWAQFATRFHSRGCYAELLGSSVSGVRQRLIDADALEDLIVSMVVSEVTDRTVQRRF